MTRRVHDPGRNLDDQSGGGGSGRAACAPNPHRLEAGLDRPTRSRAARSAESIIHTFSALWVIEHRKPTMKCEKWQNAVF
ncbi:hypothetical protein Mvan_1135 [Mycolicibacterium vanbaalenii PYR-1]|uniref:Uncharacterized protein n=1 Tax=Mycolicibacterium vanbaalenii (strain DSM 7251 / JCM 13017 / BCRC 16820 / KCTC 9966 / NRRL B-24157 / PYR-1) TaxID=350058 RepID=A1T471_MYCVP|nr:hypothetical protein Mvan_1135 [Mycolicibacterium vanbaalenii PYR-1]